MAKWRTATLGVLCAFAASSQAQVVSEMTPERVQEALVTAAEGCYMLSPAIACFTTPFSRVVVLAQAAKRKYKDIRPSEVPPAAVAAGELHVYAAARQAATGGIASVDAVVILPKGGDRKAALQPLKTIQDTSQYKNLMGAVFEGKSMTAVFPLSALAERNEVHVVYDRVVRDLPLPPPEYKVRPGDVLEVTVSGQPDLTFSPTVDNNGSVSYPVLGRVDVGGLVADEIRAKFTTLLQEYLVRPEVLLRVRLDACEDLKRTRFSWT